MQLLDEIARIISDNDFPSKESYRKASKIIALMHEYREDKPASEYEDL